MPIYLNTNDTLTEIEEKAFKLELDTVKVNMKKLITVLLTAMLLIASSAYADIFDDAMKAYNSGKYAQAIKLFKPIALKGDANAQYNLGTMYNNG
jgi:uncharacterized protein